MATRLFGELQNSTWIKAILKMTKSDKIVLMHIFVYNEEQVRENRLE